jgi:hypothetical protein
VLRYGVLLSYSLQLFPFFILVFHLKQKHEEGQRLLHYLQQTNTALAIDLSKVEYFYLKFWNTSLNFPFVSAGGTVCDSDHSVSNKYSLLHNSPVGSCSSPSLLYSGYRGFLQRIKRRGLEDINPKFVKPRLRIGTDLHPVLLFAYVTCYRVKLLIVILLIPVKKYRNLDGQTCFRCGMQQTVTYYRFQNVVSVHVRQKVALSKIVNL